MKKPTQEEWIRQLILSWKHGKTLGAAVFYATLEADTKVNMKLEDWRQAVELLQDVKPPINRDAFLGQQTAVWIADNFSHASTALFDGKYDLAIKWLESGRDTKRMRLPKKSNGGRRTTARYVVGNVRERDHKTAWNKVK